MELTIGRRREREESVTEKIGERESMGVWCIYVRVKVL